MGYRTNGLMTQNELTILSYFERYESRYPFGYMYGRGSKQIFLTTFISCLDTTSRLYARRSVMNVFEWGGAA
jgi:hypothetical protein